MTDDDTRTNIRRLERQVEANRKESADKHHAVRIEVENVRQEVREGHLERRRMHEENRARLGEQDKALAELLKIEADKKTRRDEREQLAKKLGVAFKIVSYIAGAIVGIAGFVKLILELAKHKP